MPDIYFVPAIAALVCCVVGAIRGDAPFFGLSLLGVCVACALLGLAFALTEHEIEVPGDRFAKGAALAVAVPPVFALGYYALGRALHRHRVWLAVAFVGSLFGLYYLLFIWLLFVEEFVYCLPDQYECPL
jgi:hypothetical protein